jgi:flagellar biosynthetic protein FliO
MDTASTLAMFARLVFSLAIVIGLMWVAANQLKKRGYGGVGGTRRPGAGVQVELLARRSMGRNSSIVVVRVGDRSMVVGVTDHQINNLGDIDIAEIDLESANWTATPALPAPASASSSSANSGPQPSAWKTMLDQMRNRTIRH